MKKYETFKVLAITFLILVFLSWVIPAGTFINNTYEPLGATIPIGIYDLIRIPVLGIATFIQDGLLFIMLGGFYGVLNQTGVYSNIINKISTKWDKNKKRFLIFTIILFSVLTSLTGITFLMFALAPFFIAILLKLGFNKLTAFASTIGSIFVGNIGSTFGYNVWGIISKYLNLNTTDLIFERIILLIMCVTLLILSLTKNDNKTKKSKKQEEVTIPLYEENKTNKKSLPLIILLVFTFIILLVGGYDWYRVFGIEIFNKMHQTIISLEIFDYELFNSIFGFAKIGYIEQMMHKFLLESYDIAFILVLASLVIGWVYNIKIKDIVLSFAKGAKEMLVPALFATLACVVSTYMISNQYNGYIINFLNTINNKNLTPNEFSFIGTISSSLITGFSYLNLPKAVSQITIFFVNLESNIRLVIAFIIQGMMGIIYFIAPTSVYLIAGLTFMDISYKEWIKYIWKYVLSIFIIIILVALLLATLI